MEFEFDIERYVQVLVRWAWLIVLLALIGAGLGWAYGKSREVAVLYEAEADVAAIKPFTPVDAPGTYQTLSESQNLGSDARRAILGIAKSSELASAVTNELEDGLDADDRSPGGILKRVVVSTDGDLVRITVQSGDPIKSASIANAWARVLVLRVNQLYTENPNSLEELEAQADVAWKNYQAAEAEVAKFVGEGQVEQTQRDLAAKENILDDLYTAQRNVDRLLQDARSLQQAITTDGSSSVDIANRMAVFLIRANAALLSYSGAPATSYLAPNEAAAPASTPIQPAAPNTLPLQLQVQLPPSLLSDPSQSSARSQIESVLLTLETRKKQIDAQLADSALQTQVAALRKQYQQQKSKEQQVMTARDLSWSTYKKVAAKVEELKVSRQPAGSVLRLASSAFVPSAPVVSKGELNPALLGGLAGLAISIVLAFLFEFLDKTVRSPRQVAQSLDLTVFQVQPGGAQTDLAARRAATLSSMPAPGYYQLWASLLPGQKPLDKTWLIASAVRSDGKTTTAASLAVIAAYSGRSVILVDADVLDPSVHEWFGLPNEKGWSDLLIEERHDPLNYLRQTAIPNLQVLTGGQVGAVQDALVSPRLPKLIGLLAEKADLVIFDTPALVSTADAVLIARHTEAVLIAARIRRTPRSALVQLKQQLSHVNPNLVGVVVPQAATGLLALFDQSTGPGVLGRLRRRVSLPQVSKV